MADKKKSEVNKQIVGFTKPKKILFFTIKPKPIYRDVSAVTTPGQATSAEVNTAAEQVEAGIEGGPKARRVNEQLRKRLAPALVECGITLSPEGYIKACKRKAGVIAGVVFVASLVAILYLGMSNLIILAPLIGITGYMMSYSALSLQPINKVKAMGKRAENDILFAARDMIVSMRSGLPLFNAMATVSVGYGSASKEFEKIIDRVQLGMSMDQAIEEVSEKSQSPTFKRLMLQASTSIKVGSDVVSAIQEVINDVSQERIIELRRYGQKLNAIAMFYMLFGVIFPSMGLAVASIMSTFISFFPINNNTLIIAAIGIGFLQFVFLKMVSSSRPSFST